MNHLVIILLYKIITKKSNTRINKNITESLVDKNTDIISTGTGKPINLDRFYIFLYNVKHRIKDFVNIVLYDIEGNPTINNVSYNGNIITLTIDLSQVAANEPIITYTGDGLTEQKKGNFLVYYLSNEGQTNYKAKIFSYREKYKHNKNM